MGLLEEYENKTVLITGGAGCIGSNLSRKMAELNAEKVIILDNLSSAYTWNIPKNNNIEFIKGDILDDASLKRVFKEKPDYVFHLAAHFANQNSVDNPEKDLMVNGIGILKVLEYANLIGVERFVYSSSGCGVYGLDSKMPFKEHDISINLHTPYQVTKLLGELYTNYFNNLYDLPIVNARFFNVFGPGEVPGKYRNVIPNFFYWAMTGNPLPITGDGTETRDWTFVEDIVDGLLVFKADSDAIITKGIIALLIKVLSGRKPEEVMNADLYFIDQIGLRQNLSPTRSNGLLSMVKQIKMYALAYHTKLSRA